MRPASKLKAAHANYGNPNTHIRRVDKKANPKNTQSKKIMIMVYSIAGQMSSWRHVTQRPVTPSMGGEADCRLGLGEEL